MIKAILFVLMVSPLGAAHAHPGHGDTVLHAIAHFVESGGLWLWSALAVAVGLGVWGLRGRGRSRRSKRP